MIYINAYDIAKAFGTSYLFEHLSFKVESKDRLALIGDNGTGKTTILKILIGHSDISRNTDGSLGTIATAKNLQIGYLSQDVISSLENTLLEEAELIFTNLIELEKELEALTAELANDPHNEALIVSYGKKQTNFEAKGGYAYHYKIKTILTKFGFTSEEWNRPIKTFSGGERTKVAFIKLLLMEPDLLILDEPTNHLDVETIDWLETYLKSYQGAILFVTHDRYFINNVASRIIELEDGHLNEYNGNFDFYLEEKKRRYEEQRKAYKVQQREIEKMERFIAFFKPKPRFTSRAKDREKKLARIERIKEPKNQKQAIKYRFQGSIKNTKELIALTDIVAGYDEPLIKPLSIDIYSHDKIAIMGDNGVGKTTLIKVIEKSLAPISGVVTHYGNLKIGHLEQNDFDLPENLTLFDYLHDAFPYMNNTEIRNHLGQFGFRGEEVFKLIGVISGGEKMRLLLARLVLLKFDVLLLDEPTNHLDMLSREGLIEAMQAFNATIIFISHDRHFIDSVATRIIYIQKQIPTVFEGNYEEYKEVMEVEVIKEETKVVASKNKQTPIFKGKSKKRLESELGTLEEKITANKEAQLLDENLRDYQKFAALEQEAKELEEQYLRVIEELDKFNND